MTRSLTIPAVGNGVPGVFVATVALASVFHCISATAEFSVRVGNGNEMTMIAGKGFGQQGGQTFNQIAFYNRNAVAVDVTFYSGNEEFKDTTVGQTNVVSVNVLTPSVIPFDSIVPLYDAIDSTTDTGIKMISGRPYVPANGQVDILSAYGLGGKIYQRKSVNIFNGWNDNVGIRYLDVLTVYGAAEDYFNNKLTAGNNGRCIRTLNPLTGAEFGEDWIGKTLRIRNKLASDIPLGITVLLYPNSIGTF